MLELLRDIAVATLAEVIAGLILDYSKSHRKQEKLPQQPPKHLRK